MRLIQQVIEEGKQAIVLIPEIALTYQTVRRFYAMFGDKVSVLIPDFPRESVMISSKERNVVKCR